MLHAHHQRLITLTTGALAASLLLAGCGNASPEQAGNERPQWMLAAAPDGAVSVTEAKASAQEGDAIVLRARIGGRGQPIAADSPAFVVMDLAIPHCGEIEGDTCPTPWDYCCETPKTIAANSATIIVVAEDGSTLNAQAGGLAALDEIVVVGTVGPRPSPEVLTVRATGIYAEPR